MPTHRLRTVALLARTPGLLVLNDLLLEHPDLELAAVFTHGALPKAEGAGPRSETAEFESLCAGRNVPLHVVDGPAARDISDLLPDGHLDLLVSCSWRNLVPGHVLDRFAHGCVNLHRGALPEYAGALPVQRAIEAGESRVAITAHEMTEEIDAGRTIASVWLDIDGITTPGGDPAVEAERVKAALYPLYVPLAGLSIRAKVIEARA